MTLSPEHIAHAHQWAEESRAAQGLPPTVEDRGALAKIAALLRSGNRARDPAA